MTFGVQSQPFVIEGANEQAGRTDGGQCFRLRFGVIRLFHFSRVCRHRINQPCNTHPYQQGLCTNQH